MAKLLGANNQFLSERERQALLARLKREQLKAKLEEKFGSAALVLGLAERQRKSAEERSVFVVCCFFLYVPQLVQLFCRLYNK